MWNLNKRVENVLFTWVMERVGRDHICCVCWNLVPRLVEVFAALASAALICTQQTNGMKILPLNRTANMMEIPKIGCFMLCSVEGEKEDRSQGNRKRRDLKINPKSPRETVSRESKTVHPLRVFAQLSTETTHAHVST